MALAAVAVLIAALAAVAYRHFLLFDRVLLFTDVGADSVNGFYPMWVHLADTLHAGRLPGWSFRVGLGQNVFPDAFGSPFDLILPILGRDRLPWAVAWVEVLKIVLAGTLFFALLRTLRLALPAAAAGAVLYAFSGFMVLGGTWYLFSTQGVYLALALLGFERYRRGGRWGMLVLAFFLIAAGRPLNLLNHGLVLAVWGALRVADEHGGPFRAGFRAYAGLMARVAGLGAVGTALAGVFLLPLADQMAHSQRAGVLGASGRAARMGASPFGLSDALVYKTTLLRLFGNDLLGRGSHFTGWRQYLDAPLLYVGLPGLLLAPQAFVGQPRRRRLRFAGALALGAGLMVFPYPRQALWLFSADYYRVVGFLCALPLLFLAVGALSRIWRGTARPSLPLLGGTLAVLLGLLFLPWPPPEARVDAGIRWATAGLLTAYAVAVALLARPALRRAAGAALGGLLCAEVLILATPAATARPVLTAADLAAKTGYNDFSADAAAWIRRTDPGLYRAGKTFSSSPTGYWVYRNDPMVQGFNGTSEYHSFASPAYLRFLVAVGATEVLAESEYRALIGLARRAVLHPFLGIRYLITRFPDTADLAAWTAGAPPGLVEAMYTPVARFGDVVVYKNRLALPLGFTYDRYLDYRSFLALPREGRERVLYDAFVPDPRDAEAVRGLAPLDLTRPPAPFAEAVAARGAGGLALTEAGPDRLAGTVTTPGAALLALTIPQDPGWRARVDGAPAVLHPVDFGLMGLSLRPGTHRVELAYAPPGRAAGAWLSGAGALALAGVWIGGASRRRRRP